MNPFSKLRSHSRDTSSADNSTPQTSGTPPKSSPFSLLRNSSQSKLPKPDPATASTTTADTGSNPALAPVTTAVPVVASSSISVASGTPPKSSSPLSLLRNASQSKVTTTKPATDNATPSAPVPVNGNANANASANGNPEPEALVSAYIGSVVSGVPQKPPTFTLLRTASGTFRPASSPISEPSGASVDSSSSSHKRSATLDLGKASSSVAITKPDPVPEPTSSTPVVPKEPSRSSASEPILPSEPEPPTEPTFVAEPEPPDESTARATSPEPKLPNETTSVSASVSDPKPSNEPTSASQPKPEPLPQPQPQTQLSSAREPLSRLREGETVVGFQGTDLSIGGQAGAKLACLNALRCAFALEQGGLGGAKLIRALLGRSTMQDVTALRVPLTQASSCQLDDLYALPLFSSSVAVRSSEERPGTVAGLKGLLSRLQSHQLDDSNPDDSVPALILTTTRHSFCILRLTNPSSSNGIICVFNPSSNPSLHARGSAFTLFPSVNEAVTYINTALHEPDANAKGLANGGRYEDGFCRVDTLVPKVPFPDDVGPSTYEATTALLEARLEMKNMSSGTGSSQATPSTIPSKSQSIPDTPGLTRQSSSATRSSSSKGLNPRAPTFTMAARPTSGLTLDPRSPPGPSQDPRSPPGSVQDPRSPTQDPRSPPGRSLPPSAPNAELEQLRAELDRVRTINEVLTTAPNVELEKARTEIDRLRRVNEGIMAQWRWAKDELQDMKSGGGPLAQELEETRKELDSLREKHQAVVKDWRRMHDEEVIRLKRDQAVREQREREQAARERAAKEEVAREQAAKERAAREETAREQRARDQAAREKAAREKAAREQATRDQRAMEQAARDKKAKEQAAREQSTSQPPKVERLRLTGNQTISTPPNVASPRPQSPTTTQHQTTFVEPRTPPAAIPSTAATSHPVPAGEDTDESDGVLVTPPQSASGIPPPSSGTPGPSAADTRVPVAKSTSTPTPKITPTGATPARPDIPRPSSSSSSASAPDPSAPQAVQLETLSHPVPAPTQTPASAAQAPSPGTGTISRTGPIGTTAAVTVPAPASSGVPAVPFRFNSFPDATITATSNVSADRGSVNRGAAPEARPSVDTKPKPLVTSGIPKPAASTPTLEPDDEVKIPGGWEPPRFKLPGQDDDSPVATSSRSGPPKATLVTVSAPPPADDTKPARRRSKKEIMPSRIGKRVRSDEGEGEDPASSSTNRAPKSPEEPEDDEDRPLPPVLSLPPTQPIPASSSTKGKGLSSLDFTGAVEQLLGSGFLDTVRDSPELANIFGSSPFATKDPKTSNAKKDEAGGSSRKGKEAEDRTALAASIEEQTNADAILAAQLFESINAQTPFSFASPVPAAALPTASRPAAPPASSLVPRTAPPPGPAPAPAPAQQLPGIIVFNCGVCLEGHTEDSLAVVESCQHQFCRSCLLQYIVSKLNTRTYPMLCPTCAASNSLLGPAHISRWDAELLLDQRQLIRWNELEMADIVAELSCPSCYYRTWIAAEDFRSNAVLSCPMCNHFFCKTCREATRRGVAHTCPPPAQGADLNALMQQNGWRRCPGCTILVDNVGGGCNHMQCPSAGCNTHFCYRCGEPIVKSVVRAEIQAAVENHYRACQLFVVPE